MSGTARISSTNPTPEPVKSAADPEDGEFRVVAHSALIQIGSVTDPLPSRLCKSDGDRLADWSESVRGLVRGYKIPANLSPFSNLGILSNRSL